MVHELIWHGLLMFPWIEEREPEPELSPQQSEQVFVYGTRTHLTWSSHVPLDWRTRTRTRIELQSEQVFVYGTRTHLTWSSHVPLDWRTRTQTFFVCLFIRHTANHKPRVPRSWERIRGVYSTGVTVKIPAPIHQLSRNWHLQPTDTDSVSKDCFLDLSWRKHPSFFLSCLLMWKMFINNRKS